MKLQDIYKSLGAFGCLLFCYLKEANIDTDIVKHFKKLVELGIIDEDCFVNDGNRLLQYFGSGKRIARGFNPNGNTIVTYKNGNFEHFVIVSKNRDIVFNSLENSKCVAYGVLNEESARYLV